MLGVRGLEVDYGAAPAICGVDLDVGARELVCVVGPNAAGKTTLMNAIAGLKPIRAGRVIVDGRDVSALPAHRYAEAGVAIVPESRRLFVRLTVRENLELGSYLPHAKAKRAESMERVCALFPAIEQKLASPAGALSGGQQQMVAIARALMACPRLLLLDEPSLGLAPRVVQDMFAAIRVINASATAVLLSEQNVAMALTIAHRAYVLEEGKVVAEGTAAEVMGRTEVRRAYLGAE